MRDTDTEVLRRRLWAQIGLPLATVALLSGCESSRPVTPIKQVEHDEAGAKTGKSGADADSPPANRPKLETTNDANSDYVPPARYDDIPEGEFDYFGPARDPFTEHEEEEGCPAGDWCGTAEDARKFSIQHIPDQLGCPAKIIAQPQVTNSLDKKEKRWNGLSFHPMMQGRLVSSVTQEKQGEGDKKKDICCYHWFEYCSGRPLLDGENMVVAELREGSSWSCAAEEIAAPDDRPDAELPADLRERLGQLWVEDALMEHAAIAAFERATLELMAMAAPPELLGEVQVAAADEVDHAMRCFGLAARFSGLAREPGPLATLEPRVRGLADASSEDPGREAEVERDWTRLALDTFVEGCVGETIAALVAQRARRHCDDPATHELLGSIVDDEGRHAGLAWRTIRWITHACGHHREAVIAALVQQAEAMAAEARRACEQLPAADPQAALLARYGRCDRRTELLARRDAWAELILPTLAALADAEPDGPEAWT